MLRHGPSILAVAVVGYFAYSLFQLSRLLFPRFDFHDKAGNAVPVLHPALSADDPVNITLSLRVGASSPVRVHREENVLLSDASLGANITLSASVLGRKKWRRLQKGSDGLLIAELSSPALSLPLRAATLLTVAKAVEVKPTRYNLLTGEIDPKTPLNPAPASTESPPGSAQDVPHVRLAVVVGAVLDLGPIPEGQAPTALSGSLRVDPPTGRYVPPAVAASAVTEEAWYAALPGAEEAVVRVTFAPVPFARWVLQHVMEQSVEMMRGMDASEKDLNDVRSLFADNHPVVLLATMLVSVVHLVLDVLAFKNDVQFWRGVKSMRGISVRALATSLVCEVVVALYLWQQRSSLLVLLPAAGLVLVSAWKLAKACNATLAWRGLVPTFSAAGHSTYAGSETARHDGIAAYYVGVSLAPAVLGLAVFALVHQYHEGWVDYALTSAVTAVYAFGFVMMTPQLYVNYRLKSVAHLPWRVLVYRFFNTFIDDVFAFIIRMPTLHRISTLRDDVIFICYLGQRWKYPEDSERRD